MGSHVVLTAEINVSSTYVKQYFSLYTVQIMVIVSHMKLPIKKIWQNWIRNMKLTLNFKLMLTIFIVNRNIYIQHMKCIKKPKKIMVDYHNENHTACSRYLFPTKRLVFTNGKFSWAKDIASLRYSNHLSLQIELSHTNRILYVLLIGLQK